MNNKNDNTRLVSILMNCYNGELYLSDAIDSIIGQTYQNWELIFWDNQSTDKSKAIFDYYNDSRLKYYFAPEHTALGVARERAFKHLSGDFIAVLDSDDIWFPEKLEKQLKLFIDRDVGIVISDAIFFNQFDERILYGEIFPPEGKVFRELMTGYFVTLTTVMLRKSVVDKLEYGFDSDFSYIADFDIVLRVAKISKLAICKEVLAKWRVHSVSLSWKSSITFPKERELWIEKQINQDPIFLNKYSKEISILHSKNFLLMAIDALSNNNRKRAFRLILKTNFKNWYDYALLCLCFIPYSNKMLKFLQKRRMKRLLR